jgi:WD40 repeat protein
VVHQWDAKSGAERAAPGGPFGYIRAMALAPDGKTLAAGSGPVIRLLEIPSHTERRRRFYMVGPAGAKILKIEFCSDGRRLAVLNGNGTASILRLPNP